LETVFLFFQGACPCIKSNGIRIQNPNFLNFNTLSCADCDDECVHGYFIRQVRYKESENGGEHREYEESEESEDGGEHEESKESEDGIEHLKFIYGQFVLNYLTGNWKFFFLCFRSTGK